MPPPRQAEDEFADCDTDDEDPLDHHSDASDEDVDVEVVAKRNHRRQRDYLTRLGESIKSRSESKYPGIELFIFGTTAFAPALDGRSYKSVSVGPCMTLLQDKLEATAKAMFLGKKLKDAKPYVSLGIEGIERVKDGIRPYMDEASRLGLFSFKQVEQFWSLVDKMEQEEQKIGELYPQFHAFKLAN